MKIPIVGNSPVDDESFTPASHLQKLFAHTAALGGGVEGRAHGSLREPHQHAPTRTHKLAPMRTHMHQHGITDRDLKYENVMFESREKDAEIKVIDFGLANKAVKGSEELMTEGVGTMYTLAPEVLSGQYNSKVDIWSL